MTDPFRQPEQLRQPRLWSGRSGPASLSVRAAAATACGVLALGVAAILPGCGEEEKPQMVQEAPPPPPPPPPAPKVTPIADLMVSLGIDERVRLPEELAPDNDSARVAVLQFFDGFARGDAAAVGGMLAAPDRLELEKLQKDGRWASATERISRIDVRTGQNSLGDQCALAIFHVAGGWEPQLWTYELGAQAEFAAEPTPPRVMEQLSGEDWIAAWYKILADELAKADEPDEKIVIKSVNLDSTTSDVASDGGGPSRPRGAPGRRPPTGNPIEPPGLRPGGG